MENPVPYFPGDSANGAIQQMIQRMADPSILDVRRCLFCNIFNKPGMIGVASYEGEQARLMGARPGKGRLAVYYTCIDCAAKYSSEEELANACDAQLLADITTLQKDTPQ